MKYYEEQVELDSSYPARIYIQRGDNQNNYPLHWHGDLEFDLILKGKIHGRIGNKSVTVYPNEIFFVNSGELHETGAPPNEHVEAITLLISKKLFKEHCKNFDDYYFDISRSSVIQRELRGLILRCGAVFENGGEFYELELSVLIRRICLLLLRRCRRVKEGKDKPTVFKQTRLKNIKTAISYMEEHYDSTLSLNEVAAKAGVSPGYFSRNFKRTTGENFYSYLMSIRLFNAENDLLNSDDTITDIALNNGFANTKSFINAFSKKHGVTPARFRREQQT